MDRTMGSTAAVLGLLAVAAALVIAVLPADAPAQTPQQPVSVRGVVRDANGRAIKGATVVAENSQGRNDRATATTDDRGRFTLNGLRRGVWSFVVSAQGYRDQQDVRDVAMVKSLDFRLERTPAGPPGLGRVAGRVINADIQATANMMERGEYDRAIAAYEAMLTNVPTLTTVNLLIGDAFVAKKDYARAIAAYRRLLETEPAHERARLAIADAQAKSGQLKEAETLLADAAASGGGAEVHYELGKARLALGNQQAAIESFEKAAGLSPAWGKPVCELALLANGRGDRATAARLLEQVISVGPGSAEAAEARRLLSEMKRL
jgi:TolA-binding protein